MILVFGKARSHRVPNLVCSGAKPPGWFDMLPKNCMKCDAWVGALLWWSCQSTVAHSHGLLKHPNSFRGRMFKLNTKSDIDSLLYSLSHFECHSHTVHMLTQWHLLPPVTSTVKSSLFTHVHSSPLSSAAGYIDVVKTVLVVLTMAGLFLDRSRTSLVCGKDSMSTFIDSYLKSTCIRVAPQNVSVYYNCIPTSIPKCPMHV